MPENVPHTAFAVGVVIASGIRVAYTRHRRSVRITDNRLNATDAILFSLPAFGMFIIPLIHIVTPWLAFADYRLPWWAGVAGVALFAAAVWLLWRSHANLGRNWMPTTQVHEEQRLVTNGVYRQIRHPMYAAHLLWALALPLLLQNLIAGFSMLVTILPGYLVRMPREERMMLDNFGDEYRAYMERTGRIVPRLGG